MLVNAQSIGVSLWPGTVPAEATVVSRQQESKAEIYDLWVEAPDLQAQALVRAISEWTDWSNEDLARVLNCSHLRVSALNRGTSFIRVDDLFERLYEVHEVVQRLFLIADRDTSRVDDLLTSKPESGFTAVELLSDRRPSEAYLAALEVNRPRRAGTMMRSRWPAMPGEATVAMDEASVLYGST